MLTLATFKYLTMGALLGLTSGISPGPLLTLVLTETLKHNKAAGIKIAISPLFTDLPIVLVSLFVFSKLSQFNTVLGLISIVGAAFLVYLGRETIKAKQLNIEPPSSGSESLKKGIITNILSPHPYLFWLTVGSPLAVKAFDLSWLAVILFFVSFYGLLITSKIGVALIVARSKSFLKDQSYIWIMRILGVALFIFAIIFLYDGLNYLMKV